MFFPVLARRKKERSGISDGLRIGDLRRRGGDGVTVSVRMGRSMVPESATVQGIRREASFGSDHFQHRLRLLL